MKYNVAVLGSTGSIGKSTLSIIKKNKNYQIKLLSTNKNIKKIYKQAILFKVKDVIIEDKKLYKKYKLIFKKKKNKATFGYIKY